MVCPRDKRFPAISNSPPSDVTCCPLVLSPPHLHFPLGLNPVAASPPLPLNIPTLRSPFSPSCQSLDLFFSNPRLALLSRPRLDSRAGLAWPLPTTISPQLTPAPHPFMQSCLPQHHYVPHSFFLFRMRRAFPFSTHWNRPSHINIVPGTRRHPHPIPFSR